jgi:predicted nucleic acid-binding protein
MGVVYVADTSAIIYAWSEQYPPDVFPTFWERLEQLAQEGRLIAPDEVLHELGKREDDAHTWVKEHKELIIRELTVEVQQAVKVVLVDHALLVKNGRGTADPWVIALAMVEGATVVTKETPSGSPKKPRIPDACKALKVGCCSVLDMIRAEGWRFR